MRNRTSYISKIQGPSRIPSSFSSNPHRYGPTSAGIWPGTPGGERLCYSNLHTYCTYQHWRTLAEHPRDTSRQLSNKHYKPRRHSYHQSKKTSQTANKRITLSKQLRTDPTSSLTPRKTTLHSRRTSSSRWRTRWLMQCWPHTVTPSRRASPQPPQAGAKPDSKSQTLT